MAKNDGFRRDIRLLAKKYDRRIRITNGNHMALELPNGKSPVITACSPKNPERALLNTEARLKRAVREKEKGV